MFATAASPLTATVAHPDSLGDAPMVTRTQVAVPTQGRPEGETLGRYRILREIGAGGMGRVLEAWDPELRRTVAIKVLHTAHGLGGEAVTRFLAEARVTSQLEHPGIVPVHDVGLTDDGRLFFAMKRVGGRSLRGVLSALVDGDAETVATWTRARRLEAFVRICEAVAYAHDRGVLHRDLKPDNVMVGSFGEVLVLDWGVARIRAEQASRAAQDGQGPVLVQTPRTLDGVLVGTPAYMSPEQARGGDQGPASDVFSLGAVLVELLCLYRAISGANLPAVLMATVRGEIAELVDEAGEPLPAEIADVCRRALAPKVEDRFPSALALADAVRAFTEGRRRRFEAAAHLARSAAAWDRYEALGREQESVGAHVRGLETTLPPWTPLAEKRELFAGRRRLSALTTERADAFAEVLAEAEKALARDPHSAPARAVLARTAFARFEEAEAAGRIDEQRWWEERVRRFDDGTFTPLLEGIGTVTLRTDVEAVVLAAKVESDGLFRVAAEPSRLGTTPLVDVPLAMGSWLLTIKAPGRPDVLYPVHLERGGAHSSGPTPVRIPAAPVDGFAYVPAGPTILGGDDGAGDALSRAVQHVDGFYMAELPVTVGDWVAFLNDIARHDPEQAWARVPRGGSDLGKGGQYWARPADGEAYAAPEQDRDGDRWDPMWPVMGVSWDDAQAYAAWWSRKHGRTARIPTEVQWEKAARGVDGRVFPWGDGFDPTLCKMRYSRPGANAPEPVGAFPTDASVYGVRDLAGGTREWCGDDHWDGDPARRPLRGGSWFTTDQVCRSAHRFGPSADDVSFSAGLRLVLDLEAAAPRARRSSARFSSALPSFVA